MNAAKVVLRVSILMLLGQAVWAADLSVDDRARLRLYDGGMDEQPIQVQAPTYARIKPSNEPIPLEEPAVEMRAPASVEDAVDGVSDEPSDSTATPNSDVQGQ